MEDVFGFQMKTGGDHSGSGIAMPDFPARFLQLLITRSLEDRAADTAACQKALIRSVDDRIGRQIGNAGFSDFYRTHGAVF